MTADHRRNWAGNVRYRAGSVARPATVDELADIMRTSRAVRAVGTGHSFNRIADTDGVLVSVAELPRGVEIDSTRGVARVCAGMRYGDVAAKLEVAGWALPNLASLPHISVGGAVATGTHGSGDGVGSLAASVAGLRFVAPGGEAHELVRGDADFDGAVVALGALGIAVVVDLDIVPTFRVAQTVYDGLRWDRVLGDLGAVTSLGYNTSMFATWRDPDVLDHLWVKVRTGATVPPDVLGAPQASVDRHPIPGFSAENCTPQLGDPGPWLDRLPHFRMGFQPSNGDELQSEYLVPRDRAVRAIESLRGMAERIAPLVQVCEVRTVAADELWLSPAFETDVVGLHFTWLPDQPRVEALLADIETALAPTGARPHWGKLFVRRDVGGLYPRWDDFVRLRAEYDPRGVLRGDLLPAFGL